MTNPHIDKIIKTPKGKSNQKGNAVINFLVILAIIVLVAFMFGDRIIYSLQPRAECQCCKFETDAQNTLAALASYFSESEHDEIPTLQDLMRTEDLTLNKNSTVIIDGSKDAIRVSVIDNKRKCPRGNIYEVYMGGTAGYWYSDEEIDPHDPKLGPPSFFID